MQKIARFSLRVRHARILGTVYVQPRRPQQQFRHILSTMSGGAAETDTQAAAVANSSGITPASLKTTLTEKLEALYVEVEDISGKL